MGGLSTLATAHIRSLSSLPYAHASGANDKHPDPVPSPLASKRPLVSPHKLEGTMVRSRVSQCRCRLAINRSLPAALCASPRCHARLSLLVAFNHAQRIRGPLSDQSVADVGGGGSFEASA